jgi:hypothetical protein
MNVPERIFFTYDIEEFFDQNPVNMNIPAPKNRVFQMGTKIQNDDFLGNGTNNLHLYSVVYEEC